MTLRQAAEKAVRVLRDGGHTALFAGGCVRDMLLGAEPKDIDIATDAPPERVMALFRRTRAVGAKFGVVMTRIGRHEFEIATFRTESDYADHRRPDAVTFSTADEDAKRRDFTINGMFYDPLGEEVIDYVGGRADVDARLVRAIGDPNERLEEDHLRMLRAVRFAARLGFAIEAETYAAVQRHADRIRTISAERVRQELEQILTHPTRQRGWELVHASGLSAHLVEGVTWSDIEAEAVASRLGALPDEAWFPTAWRSFWRSWMIAECRRFVAGFVWAIGSWRRPGGCTRNCPGRCGLRSWNWLT
jgi:poly(A) polymerase